MFGECVVKNLAVVRVHRGVLSAMQVFADKFEFFREDKFTFFERFEDIQSHFEIVDIVKSKLNSSVALNLNLFLLSEFLVFELSEHFSKKLIHTVAVQPITLTRILCHFSSLNAQFIYI